MRAVLAALLFAAALPAAAQDTRQITQAIQFCNEHAMAKCGRNTTYCKSYRRSFLKICLINQGVPPDYIAVLLMD